MLLTYNDVGSRRRKEKKKKCALSAIYTVAAELMNSFRMNEEGLGDINEFQGLIPISHYKLLK